MGSHGRRLSAVDPLKPWAGSLVRRVAAADDQVDAMALVGAVADRAFDGSPPPGWSQAVDREARSLLDEVDDPPGGWHNPWLVGLVHERAVSASVRRNRGAWYTPPSLVRGLVRLVADVVEMPVFAVDPTCGGGAFLLALLDHWVDNGLCPAEALTRVAGFDIDADAVGVCRLALALWGRSQGLDIDNEVVTTTVRTVDALTVDYPRCWPDRRLVIGNPPFATPLKTSQGNIPESAENYRSLHRHELGQYADLAAIHLHRAVSTSGPDGVVMLVMPQSVLSSRDVAGLRARIADDSATVAMWAAREAVFDAGVRACAPLIVVGRRPPETVVLAAGPEAHRVGRAMAEEQPGSAWAAHAARSLGAPELPAAVTRPVGLLGDLCTATAGFRDEYYGLVAAAREWTGPDRPPNRLVTVGSVDPLATRWGHGGIRFGGRLWNAPYVGHDGLEGKVARWVERQAVSKLVVATQSKLIEPVLDPGGELVPSTPLLSVHGGRDDLPYIAAVLLAPPVVASAWQRWFGSALGVDALKLAAGQLVELPVPGDRRAWTAAAELIAAALEERPDGLTVAEGWAVAAEAAALMNSAYRADSNVLDWWLERVPPRNAPVAADPDG